MNSVIRVLLLVTLTALLSGCAFFGLTTKLKVYNVKLNPVGGGELEVLTPSNRCLESRNPHDGCLLFKRDKIGLITFYLAGSKKTMKTCADPGVNRVITEVKLTATGAGGNQTAEKGDFGSAVGFVDLKAQAFPAFDTGTGNAFTAPTVNDGRTLVRLVNLNANDYVAGSFSPFWYQITVTHCTNGSVWQTDPRGDNEGTQW